MMTRPVERNAWRSAASDALWLTALVAGTAVVWTVRVIGTATELRPMDAGDSYGYFLPAYAYQASRIAAGGFPFWNPYQGAGVPFLASLQPGALYPARLLMIVVSPPRAMAWSAFLHVLLGLVATFALCRRLGSTPAGAAMAAVVFTTAVALPALGAPTTLEPGAWLPMVALATVAVVGGGGWGWTVALGVAGAMPALAGGYQVTLYAAYAAATFALAAAAARPAALGVGVAGRLGVGGLLALATAAPQLLPTVLWSAETVRRTAPLTDVQMLPIFSDATWWDAFSGVFFRSTYPFGYLSIPVVALAVVGLVAARPVGLVLGLAALGFGALALAAWQSPALAAYRALPGLAMFRFPLRLLMLASLCAATTAALGLAVLARVPALATPRRRVVVEGAVLAVVLALVVWPFRYDVQMPWSDDAVLARPDARFFPGATRPAAAERVAVPGDRLDLRMGAFPRQGMLQQVRVLQDYEPLSSRRLAAFLSTVAGLERPRPETFPPFTGAVRGRHELAHPALLDLVAVRAILAPASTIPSTGMPGWTEVARAGDLVTYRNDRALPRAYVVGRARFVADEDAALDAITAAGFDARREAILVGTPARDQERALADGPATPLAGARIVVDDAEHVAVEVDAPGLLVLADAFAPGWEAFVDGRQRRIWQANHLVRAVALQPGDRRVDFRFHAPGFALGVAACVATWTFLLAGLAAGRLRRRFGPPAVT